MSATVFAIAIPTRKDYSAPCGLFTVAGRLANDLTISRKRREHHFQSNETDTRRLAAASWCWTALAEGAKLPPCLSEGRDLSHDGASSASATDDRFTQAPTHPHVRAEAQMGQYPNPGERR